MIYLVTSFKDSAKEFSKLRSLIMAALLVTLHTIMACFMSIVVTDSLRISISFLANVVAGCMFGPVMGFVCGGIGDVIQYLIKPTGPYFFGWTLSAALAGLIYGCFFYHKTPKDMSVTEKEISTWKMNLRGILLWGITVLEVVAWVTVPFLHITDKSGTVLLDHGSAYSAVSHLFMKNGSKNAAIVSILLLVMVIILLVLNIWKLHAVPLFLAVVGTFTSLLSVYTDKKTTNALWGFWLMLAGLLIYCAIQIIILAEKHAVDLSFMIRCVIALTVDTLLVNVLLGTYWVNVMYGKGFAFYLTTRLIKNLIQLPINIILTYYVLGFLRNIIKKMKYNMNE